MTVIIVPTFSIERKPEYVSSAGPKLLSDVMMSPFLVLNWREV